jgi:8-oxo-dGTP pyrophosphatase MutT (NUDIX family)
VGVGRGVFFGPKHRVDRVCRNGGLLVAHVSAGAAPWAAAQGPRMKRAALLTALAAYVPFDAHERKMQAEIARFIALHETCFERTLRVGHVTASAWVVDESGSRTLLTHHRKLGKWLQFGGHADGDPDVRAVALREAREESGLTRLRFAQPGIYDLDTHAIPAYGEEAAHVHYDIRFALCADRSEQPAVSEESYDVRWIALSDLGSLNVDDSVLRLAAKTPALRVPHTFQAVGTRI